MTEGGERRREERLREGERGERALREGRRRERRSPTVWGRM